MAGTYGLVLAIGGWLTAGCGGDDAAASAQSEASTRDTISVVVPVDGRTMLEVARAHDRADVRDSAAAEYLAAAALLPDIADWLVLRAAGVMGDGAARAALYSRLKTDVARDRVRWTEALARERTGDIAGAITAYAAVGARVSEFRLRLARAGAADKPRVLSDLLDVIAASPGSDLARDAIALFDAAAAKPKPREQLVIARAAASVASWRRAAAAFRAAFAARLGESRDRFTYGTVLARLDRDRDAATQFARVKGVSALAAGAQYQRARAQLAYGDVVAARVTLRSIMTKWPSDTSTASALMLLSDLAADENRDNDARTTLLDAARRFPSTRHAPVALFRAAMIAFIRGRHAEAADEFTSLGRRYPGSEDATAALYWAGRAHDAAGRRSRADSAWHDVMARDSGSYYSVLAAERLRTPLQLGNAPVAAASAIPELDSGLRRIALLDSLALSVEERHEYDRLFRDAAQSPGRMVATARAFSGTQQASRAVALGWRVLAETGRNPANYRLVYPLLEREGIIAEARANGLDPVLVAALIRQESNFNPRATSPAGARGLMQVMPDVGARIAARRGMTGFTTASLYDPAVNIPFGIAHLRGLVLGYPNVERAFAAYNAGESRVARWAQKAGASDPEVFTERIPFVETRGYVRAILRNRAFYRALYSW